jgi:mono/diheme cytochrome c family protein
MNRTVLLMLAAVGILGLGVLAFTGRPSPTPAAAAQAATPSPHVARGKYLVTIMGCNDCHTPWKATPKGSEPDMTRMLSGHPDTLSVTAAADLGKGPWTWAATSTNTGFSGPWGVSFAANLTPDGETGLGKWTADTFMSALRTGRHEGQGRPILPPMPFPMIRQATDEDLRAIFAYLQSIPAIRNRVPQPIEPPETR